MRRHAVLAGLATLVSFAALACAGGDAARAESAPPASARAMVAARDSLESNPLALRRAAAEQRRGALHDVVDQLERIDFTDETQFPEADRAAFLLGQAYLELGSVERFTRLASAVARWKRQTPYTQWLAYRLLWVDAEVAASPRIEAGARPDTSNSGEAAVDSLSGVIPADAAPIDALAAARSLTAGDPEAALRRIADAEAHGASSPLAAYLKALALAAAGRDDEHALAEAAADTVSALGRDLAGAANVRRASLALARGEDPREVLAGTPAGSRHASTARHMLGLIAWEQGDVDESRRILGSLLADDPQYPARREVRMAIAGQELEAGHWEAAHGHYQAVDHDWAETRDAIERLRGGEFIDTLWAEWDSGSSQSEVLRLDPAPVRALAERLAEASLDLRTRPNLELPPLAVPPASASAGLVAPPPAEDLRALMSAARRWDETHYALERVHHAAAREREALSSRRRYLDVGLGRVRDEEAQLRAHVADLDSLGGSLASIDARLQALRDAWSRRVALRTQRMIEACAKNILWIHGMRFYHLSGPHLERPLHVPTGYPAPDTVLTEEERLAGALRAVVERIAADAPTLIARSYERGWRPNLIDRVADLSEVAKRSLAWAGVLGVSIDSSLAAAATSDSLRRLEALSRSLERDADSLRASHDAMRARLAREAVERARAALDGEREGIDYGLAASAYGVAVGLAPDSVGPTVTVAKATGDVPAAGATPTPSGDEVFDDPVAVRWREEAIDRLRTFLDRHPESPTRGEVRFRLADLLLVDARQDFREQMAAYVRAQGEGGGSGVTLPILSYAPALELYRAILEQDADFPHRDAVLFNAGMILADDADPGALRFLNELVTLHPESPYCQEAYLRMGDMQFHEEGFKECVALYQHAAEGRDPSLRAIALYKMGWAQFNQERFLDAVDAFRSVLDLYAAESTIVLQVDVEREAEADLIQTLARAGGAPAFAEYFDRIGSRPYETRVLMALGEHFRRYSLHADAAAADQLFLKRYPLRAEALSSAQRLADTYQTSEHVAMAREARLTYAPRFAPDGDWSKAQTSDSLRVAGAEFARSSLKSVAHDLHREARASGSAEDWREALRLYEEVLSKWPDDPEAPVLELQAGEASARLGAHVAALEHYRNAARSGPDSIASEALWQRVAVTDAWYESTRSSSTASRASLGSDSLAHAVIVAADELMARFPDHHAAPDLLWREGHLGLAHGWNERAAADFGRLVTRHPDDPRAPHAAGLRADALVRTSKFDAAGAAYEEALAVAQRAGADSLARVAERAIPICYFRYAEAAVAADSNNFARHAALFEKVAARWPKYEHAHVAQYRAGLAYIKAGAPAEAVRAMQTLIRDFPSSEFVRDAHLQIAKTWEASGEREKAGQAYIDFAQRYPDDSSSADAWLKAADLFAAAGLTTRADELRLAYIQKFPNDVETAMEILEALARRDIESIGPERPISKLVGETDSPRDTTKRSAKSRAKGKAPAATPPAPPPSHLAAYLRLAAAHPELASPGLLAQVRFLRGEEANAAYAALPLRQPLDRSIKAKQGLLDKVIARYRESVSLGVPEWTHASTFRIGEVLVAFGDALKQSERPADLKADDLQGYEEVLLEQCQVFYDRGEGVWTELLRQKGSEASEDPWIARTRTSLWQRLGSRFYYRPEVDFPLVAANSPERIRPDKADSTGPPKHSKKKNQRAKQEGGSR